MKKRLMAILLAVVMVISMMPVGVMAADSGEDKDPIVYVSLGDSMTNGYGLDGYNGDTGVYDYGIEAYANKFAAWLAGYEGAITERQTVFTGTKGTVDHRPLAMSGMRVEDLHWLLELDYTDDGAIAITDAGWDEAVWNAKFSTGDYWTWKELCDDYRMANAAYAIKNGGDLGKITDKEAVIVAEHYQTSVKNADVISLGIGNGNFGVFMLGRILEAIGFDGEPEDVMVYDIERAISECDPEMQAHILKLKDELYAIAEDYIGTIDDGDDSVTTPMEALANTVVYTGLSYVLNYAGCVEAILRLNPKAEIILVALMNTFEENEDGSASVPAGETGSDEISLGELMNAVFTPLNAYIAALPTYMQLAENSVYTDATFYYAETNDVQCMVEVYGDDFYNEDGTSNTGSIIRDRFFDSIVGCCKCGNNPAHSNKAECGGWETGMVWDFAPGIVKGLGMQLDDRLSLAGVMAYDDMSDEGKAAAAAANPQNALSCALYLAFEEAIKNGDSAPTSVNSVLGLGDLMSNTNVFDLVIADFSSKIDINGAAYVEAAKAGVTAVAFDTAAAKTSEELTTQLPVPGVEVKVSAEKLTGDADAALENAKLIIKDIVFAISGIEDRETFELAFEDSEALKTHYDELVSEHANTIAGALMLGYEGAVQGATTQATPQNIGMLCMLLALPETLGLSLQTADPAIYGLLGLFARCIIGNGLGCHPSAGGHDTLFAAIKWSYENGYTSEDETEDNINKAVDAAIKLIYENRHEIYAYAYSYAAEEGYIDIAIKELETLRGYINAVDYASSGASAELKEKLAAVIEELNVDIDALIKFIKDAQTLEVFEGQILDLIGEFTNDMALFEALLKQAEIDSQKQLDALYKAIQKYITDTLNAVYDYVYDMIAEIYDELVDEIAALAAEYGPEAEAFVREWLYKNPQAVISALIEFGEDVDAFINYWTPYVKLILGPAWDAYGGDLMAALAELVELLKAEATELGGQALEALVKYIESLNLEAQIEAIAKALKDGSVEIGEKTFGELTGIVEELDGKLGGNVSAIVAALEELAASEDAAAAKAVIQETIESILAQEEELSAQILSIEGDILAAKAEIETAVTAIDSLYDIIKPLIIVLNNPDQFDLSDTADAVKAIIAELTTAAKAVQNAAEILVTLTGDINTAARKIDAALKAMYADLSTAAGKIETTLVEAGAAADALMVDTYTAIENLVTTTGGKVTTDAATLVAFCREKVTAAVNEFIAAAETAIYKATHGELLVDAKTRYLTIGDDEDVYTTELAALLGLEDYQIVSRLTADTDLVTVDFGRTDFSDFINAQAAGYVAEIVNGNEALAGLLSGSYGTAVKAALDSYGIDLTAEVAELNWDKYLDAKAIGVKDETIKGIRITAVDHGLMETYTLDLGAMLQPVLDAETGVPGTVTIDCVIEIPVADLACALLDNVLYSYVSFAADYAVALDEIREVAPDAEVVVLGLVDADEDLVFSVGEAVIDLGDYTDILVNFVNAHYFAYALVNGEDVTYVAENTAEAIYNALNIRSIDWWTCDGGDNCACKVFTDLKCDAWYHNAICYNYNFGLMIGMSADKFEPSTTTSRAMIVTTLYRLEGSPAVTGENSYKDVKDGAWYTDAIIWATENGIVEGYGNGLFGPNNDVTREQIATMLYRYADYLGMDVSDTIALDAYTDADEIHGWALDAMKWANAVKLMEGRTETTINPRDNTMRSELATLLYRWDHGFAE